MAVIYVFTASDLESEPIRRTGQAGSLKSILRCGDNDVVLLSGAMGPRNARRAAESAFGLTAIPKPDAVLVTGLCGGLTPSLREGNLVLYDSALTTEVAGGEANSSPQMTNSIVDLLKNSNIDCQRVKGITSTRIAINQEEKAALGKTGADVVDMESYPILAAARAAGFPAAVLRVVSDSVDRSLPDLNRALDESGGLDNKKALGVALSSPLATFKLLKANKRAMQRLARPLELVVKASCFG